MNDYLRYSSMGFEIVAYVLIFVGIGYGLDRWLDTKPWFTMTMSILGCGAAMYQTVKKLMK